jgi:hypothetical protein
MSLLVLKLPAVFYLVVVLWLWREYEDDVVVETMMMMMMMMW